MRRTGIVLAVLLAATSQTGFGWGTYTVGVTESPEYWPAFAAEAEGFWKEDNLSLGVWLQSDPEQILYEAAYRYSRTGRLCVDFLVCRAGDFAWQKAQGLRFVPVAIVARDAGRTQLVLRQDVPDVAGLKGRRIACDTRTADLMFLAEALQRAGLSLDAVTVVDQGGTNNPRPFLAGEVEAVVIDADGAAVCVDKGPGKVAAGGKDVPDPLAYVVCTKDFIAQKHPQAVELFLRGYVRGAAWVGGHANRATLASLLDGRFYFLKYRPESPPLSPAFVEAGLAGLQFLESPVQGPELQRVIQAAETFVARRLPAAASSPANPPAAAEDLVAPPGAASANWHNVKDYGARGDGRTDDWSAIQTAIDACQFSSTDPRYTKRQGPRDGVAWGGVVFIPTGVYRTSRPLVLHQNVTILGDAGVRPIIDSQAEAGMVWWKGDWNDRKIDFKVRSSQSRRCTGVRLENLWVQGRRFGGHTMGTVANNLRMNNCRFEGAEAGFVSTGFLLFSEIRNSQFGPSLWILAKEGSRFNTSVVENIEIGLNGESFDDWAMRLEGCIQCVRLSEIAFEARKKGIYLDANAAGVTIDIRNVWDFDTGHKGPEPEVLRIVNGQGISVSNVMAMDLPANIFVGKDVRDIVFQNVVAKSLTVEDPKATRPVLRCVRTSVPIDRNMTEDAPEG